MADIVEVLKAKIKSGSFYERSSSSDCIQNTWSEAFEDFYFHVKGSFQMEAKDINLCPCHNDKAVAVIYGEAEDGLNGGYASIMAIIMWTHKGTIQFRLIEFIEKITDNVVSVLFYKHD